MTASAQGTHPERHVSGQGRLQGRVAIVTGSGRNIGRAIALAFARQGCAVVVNGHSDRAAVDAVVEGLRLGEARQPKV